MKIFRDERAQVSAEMLVIIAAVLAVAILLVTNLQSTAAEGSKKLQEKSSEVLVKIDGIK